jgi:hypothetical protein
VRGAIVGALRAVPPETIGLDGARLASAVRVAVGGPPKDEFQFGRCLDALVADGLVEPLDRGQYRLPG